MSVLFCQYLTILVALVWFMPVDAAESIARDILRPEQTVISNANVAINNQLFKPGLYWNPQRPGWGINITQVSQDNGINQLVAVIYTYRADGTPVWYLASAPINGSSWNASLQEYFWNGSSAISTDIGTIELDFNAFDKASMSYRIHSENGSEEIQFFDFAQGQTQVDFTALWFPPSQPGRGLTVSTIGNTNVVVLYFYDVDGNPLWLLGVLDQFIVLGSELKIPVDSFTGYCLACATVNTRATRAGEVSLMFNTRSSAQLVTENIFGWQTDVTIVPLSDVPGTNRNGEDPVVSEGGDCVNIPLITNGSHLVVKVTSPSLAPGTSETIKDMIFTDVSETRLTIEEIVTTETTILGITQMSRREITDTIFRTISENKIFLNSVNTTFKTETDTFISETRFTPGSFRGPILKYCEGQAWTQPSVTQTITFNGETNTSSLPVKEGVVVSVNESITVPAGRFSTVLLTRKSANTIHKEWFDIASGLQIKTEEFDLGKTVPKVLTEAILVQ